MNFDDLNISILDKIKNCNDPIVFIRIYNQINDIFLSDDIFLAGNIKKEDHIKKSCKNFSSNRSDTIASKFSNSKEALKTFCFLYQEITLKEPNDDIPLLQEWPAIKSNEPITPDMSKKERDKILEKRKILEKKIKSTRPSDKNDKLYNCTEDILNQNNYTQKIFKGLFMSLVKEIKRIKNKDDKNKNKNKETTIEKKIKDGSWFEISKIYTLFCINFYYVPTKYKIPIDNTPSFNISSETVREIISKYVNINKESLLKKIQKDIQNAKKNAKGLKKDINEMDESCGISQDFDESIEGFKKDINEIDVSFRISQDFEEKLYPSNSKSVAPDLKVLYPKSTSESTSESKPVNILDGLEKPEEKLNTIINFFKRIASKLLPIFDKFKDFLSKITPGGKAFNNIFKIKKSFEDFNEKRKRIELLRKPPEEIKDKIYEHFSSKQSSDNSNINQDSVYKASVYKASVYKEYIKTKTFYKSIAALYKIVKKILSLILNLSSILSLIIPPLAAIINSASLISTGLFRIMDFSLNLYKRAKGAIKWFKGTKGKNRELLADAIFISIASMPHQTDDIKNWLKEVSNNEGKSGIKNLLTWD